MRIVYMGTPEFAVPGLKILVENGYDIAGVITAPDKPQGRGLKLGETPVKEYAKSQNLKILQPEKLKDEAFLKELQSLDADLQVVVAFRMLPEVVWSMPPLGTFNLHASLLPQYRGAAPINWAIINGEKETGVTTFFLQHEIDTGDIILQEKEPVFDHDTAGTLYERLMNKGAEVILKTVQMIEKNQVVTHKQVALSDLKPAPKIFKEHCKIDWQLTAEQVRNFVRGMAPYPTAYTHLNGRYCKIFEVSVVPKTEFEVGQVESDGKNYVHIGCGEGVVAIESLQMEGKKKMGIREFLLGNKCMSVE